MKKTVIEGVLSKDIGSGFDGTEYQLKIDDDVIIAANCGLFGWLKKHVGKRVTIIIEE